MFEAPWSLISSADTEASGLSLVRFGARMRVPVTTTCSAEVSGVPAVCAPSGACWAKADPPADKTAISAKALNRRFAYQIFILCSSNSREFGQKRSLQGGPFAALIDVYSDFL